MTTTAPHVSTYGEPGSTNLQWKGIDVCVDVFCLTPTCEFFHVDARMPFSGFVRCPTCDRLMELGREVTVKDADPSDAHAAQFAVTGDAS